MKKLQYILPLILVLPLLGSCEKFLEPELDNQLTDEEMLANPAFYEGLLLSAYQAMPGQYSNMDVASDNAVTNDKESPYLRMATGEWSASFSPVSQWGWAYMWIYYINAFLENMEEVVWDLDEPEINQGHLRRLKGEAYGLRAWYQMRLLMVHSGTGTDGSLLGFSIVDEVIGIEDDFRIPRSGYEVCVDRIMADLDSAIANLPDVYEDIKGDNDHNRTQGVRYTNRMNGLAARALKVRLAQHAASPAFGIYTQEQVAVLAGELIAANGGMAAFVSDVNKGLKFWLSPDSPEIIWACSIAKNLSLEEENFPPSLFGKGRTNPSQELVDVFYMQNGFPIDHPASLYDPDNPYKNRDPRLSMFILRNGGLLKEKVISTSIGSGDDGINSLLTSTRTGYYLKKLLHENVNLEAGNTNPTNHFYTYARWSEIFLIYAEAANEAWGPDGDPNGYGFTPKEIIRAFRLRAGFRQPDTFMDYYVGNTGALREVIRAERRVELCFEGFRFWDMRRNLELETMKKPVSGMFITDSTGTHQVQEVEPRAYEDYMISAPIPYIETLKFDIIQNQGWN